MQLVIRIRHIPPQVPEEHAGTTAAGTEKSDQQEPL